MPLKDLRYQILERHYFDGFVYKIISRNNVHMHLSNIKKLIDCWGYIFK